jgi:hypothetical protein
LQKREIGNVSASTLILVLLLFSNFDMVVATATEVRHATVPVIFDASNA